MEHINESEENVQLFGGEWTLDNVYNAETNTYYVPFLTEQHIGFDIKKLRDHFKSLKSGGRLSEKAQLLAVLDTGIFTQHPFLRPHIEEAVDFTGEGPEDQEGHGTMGSILLVMIAPDARILSVKVVGKKGGSKEQINRIVQGIQWAVDRGARIINLSIGFTGKCREHHKPICDAIKEAIARNVIVVVAAEAKCPAECHPDIIVAGVFNKTRQLEIANTIPTFNILVAQEKAFMVPYEKWIDHLEKE